MLTFSIDDLMGSDFSRNREAVSFNGNFSEDSIRNREAVSFNGNLGEDSPRNRESVSFDGHFSEDSLMNRKAVSFNGNFGEDSLRNREAVSFNGNFSEDSLRNLEAVSFNGNFSEDSLNSTPQSGSANSSVSSSSDTSENIAHILLSLDKQAKTVSPIGGQKPSVLPSSNKIGPLGFSDNQYQNGSEADNLPTVNRSAIRSQSVLPSRKADVNTFPSTGLTHSKSLPPEANQNNTTTGKVSGNVLPMSSSLRAHSKDTTEKPEHSYIALISMAILQSPERKLVLADIYQYIMDNFRYYNNKEKAWRNSIRHNLSLNECFMKNGRADNGKGNYWSIHPSCEEDFSKGDFRRRQARRRTRKSLKEANMGYYPTVKYGYDVGYVPMTSSPVAYHPYLSTSPCMMWTPPQLPAPHCYYLGGGAYTQTFSPKNIPQSVCSPIPIPQYPHQTSEAFTTVS